MQSNNQPGAAGRMVVLVIIVGSNDKKPKRLKSGYGGRGEYSERKETTKKITKGEGWVFQTEEEEEDENSKPRLQVEGGKKTVEREKERE